MIAGILIVTFIYLITIIWILNGMQKLAYFENSNLVSKTSFSIIIPFRNEENSLPVLIDSLLKLSYNKDQYELLFVDDESEDSSISIIENEFKNSEIDFTILRNKRYSNSPKKDAISLAVKEAKYPWIVTTDADCRVKKGWLKILDLFIQKEKPKMVCMSVIFKKDNTLVKQFQFFDGLSLQAVTMGGFGNKMPLLCNGANLAYEKELFFEVAGYVNNDQYASGDDIFLMEKIKQVYPKKINYLKNSSAIVTTESIPEWGNLFQQRIRWASKTKHQNNNSVKVLGGITVLSNIVFIFCIMGCFVFPLQVSLFLSFILFKIILDVVTINQSALFFEQKFSLFYLLVSTLLYPFILVWVLGNSLLGTYKWKGRSFKK